jgi:hypothetical protein
MGQVITKSRDNLDILIKQFGDTFDSVVGIWLLATLRLLKSMVVPVSKYRILISSRL